jgi:hypothetical protein
MPRYTKGAQKALELMELTAKRKDVFDAGFTKSKASATAQRLSQGCREARSVA